MQTGRRAQLQRDLAAGGERGRHRERAGSMILILNSHLVRASDSCYICLEFFSLNVIADHLHLLHIHLWLPRASRIHPHILCPGKFLINSNLDFHEFPKKKVITLSP